MKDFLQKKFGKKQLHRASGFSMVELMVSIAIFTMLSSMLVINQNGFNNKVNTDTLAHQLAQWVRDAQISSMGSRRSAAGTFVTGYGLYFSAAEDDQFIYFSDGDNNGVYTTGSSDRIEQTVRLLNGYRFSAICGQHSGIPGTSLCNARSSFAALSYVNVSFRRPNPDANIKGPQLSGFDVYSPLRLVITAPKGYTRTVVIYVTGQVSVE